MFYFQPSEFVYVFDLSYWTYITTEIILFFTNLGILIKEDKLQVSGVPKTGTCLLVLTFIIEALKLTWSGNQVSML
jgi:hypothetical protein